ncbi:MAG: hypothetical protein C0618_00840 [Desulfuromonas sp.]|nr:MAG: hypothetical protein C0618_00840 [Desulfuromonas sp.]
MKSMIDSVMAGAFNDFRASLQEKGALCSLKDFRFNEMMIPDYSDDFIQEAYLLRYFPAYLVEYYGIYKELLKAHQFEGPFKVLSIGCGCGLDYYGLELALREKGSSCQDKVFYTGIDKIDWIYRDNFGNDDFEFFQGDILDFEDISKINDNEFDVIIFPKSIGEFEDNEFKKLKDIFKRSQFSKKSLLIVSSVRKQHSAIDTNRMASVLRILENDHGYSCPKAKTEYTYYKKVVGLRTYFYDFVYPQEAYDYLSALHEKCPKYISNSKYCEDDCKGNLNNKRPILNTGHIRYQIFDLTR